MSKNMQKLIIAAGAMLMTAGCFAPTRSTTTIYREDGSIEQVIQSSESVVKTLSESTKNKTVIAWQSGWMAYASVSIATTQDPTPGAKIFAGKSDSGVISTLPNQKNWDGIARTIQATRQDLTVGADGISSVGTSIQD